MIARRRATVHAAVLALACLSACANVAAPPSAATQALAPAGTLRVGLYPGTPTSIVGDPASGDAKGVGFDLGRELARRAGVPFEAVVFPNNAAVQAAAKAATVDMVFTNATPARRNDLDFSPTVLEVELGYLVPAGSSIRGADQLDRAGGRVGVSAGSTSAGALARVFRNATLVPTASLTAAIEMLRTGTLDAFATNKATLFEMAEKLPGSKVLEGRWGIERHAIAIPKGREQAMAFIRQFTSEVKSEGVVGAAIARAGLRGAAISAAE